MSGTVSRCHTCLIRMIAVAGVCANLTVAHAGGEQVSRTAADLSVVLDTRWVGTYEGGYYPVRVDVQNAGPDRELVFRLRPRYQEGSAPTVERTITLEEGSPPIEFTLSVPIVSPFMPDLRFEVLRDGEVIEALQMDLNLPSQDGGPIERPAILMVTNTNPNMTPLEAAIDLRLPQSGSERGYYQGNGVIENHETLEPSGLPARWIDYTGVDLVILSLEQLDQLPAEKRSALLEWTRTGGNLIVHSVGEDPRRSETALELVGLVNASEGSWKTAGDVQLEVFPPNTPVGQNGNSFPIEIEASRRNENSRPRLKEPFAWTRTESTFVMQPLMLGTLTMLPEDPFDGTYNDWAWLLGGMNPAFLRWTNRHGFSARQGSDEFLDFVNPNVRGVPIYSFLILITLFTLVIGPLNYIILWRKKKLNLLILSIPIIAAFTSVTLFTYSVFAYGFSIESRMRSLTILNSDESSAVSTSRLALYAGFAPTDGLQFSTDTAVYPVWSPASRFEAGTVDWTDGQTLTNGWLRSRTRTQFVTVEHRRERGRVIVSPVDDETVTFENGLAVDLEMVVLITESGEVLTGPMISAGESVNLTPATSDQRRDFAEILRLTEPEPPPELATANISSRNGYRYTSYNSATPTQFKNGFLEQYYALAKSVSVTPEILPRRTYFAVTKSNPGIDTGVDLRQTDIDIHLIHGWY